MDGAEVRLRTWTRGSVEDQESGLLGYLSLFVGEFVIDGATVRRTSAGKLTISWPERRDRQGRAHPYVRPINDEARRRIEKVIFGLAVGQEERW